MVRGAATTCTSDDATGHTVGVRDHDLTITELAALGGALGDEIAEQLARWHSQEWGHLYDPDVWNLDVARREFAEQRASGGGMVPSTYVALSSTGELLGSVSLVVSDDLAGFESRTPWLASLFVIPSWRRRGVGRRLVAYLLAQPPARSAGEVWLFTADHTTWYQAQGWRAVATTVSGPDRHEVTVMTIRAEEAEGSESHRHPVP